MKSNTYVQGPECPRLLCLYSILPVLYYYVVIICVKSNTGVQGPECPGLLRQERHQTLCGGESRLHP